jgi:hypothetical protein
MGNTTAHSNASNVDLIRDHRKLAAKTTMLRMMAPMSNMLANFYSTTAGSLIQTHSFAKFKSSNSFIINKTWLESTTAGSLIQFLPYLDALPDAGKTIVPVKR